MTPLRSQSQGADPEAGLGSGSSASPPGRFRRCDLPPRPHRCLSSPRPSGASATRATTVAWHARSRPTESKRLGRQCVLEAHTVLLKSRRPHVLVDGFGQGTGPLSVSSSPDPCRGFSRF